MTEERDLFYEYYNETGEWADTASEVERYFGGSNRDRGRSTTGREYDAWRSGRNRMSGEPLNFWEFDTAPPPETPPISVPDMGETPEQKMYRELQERLKAMDLAAAQAQKEVLIAAGTPWPESTPAEGYTFTPRKNLWEVLDGIRKRDNGLPTWEWGELDVLAWQDEHIVPAVESFFNSEFVQNARGPVAKGLALAQQAWGGYIDFINMPWYMQRQMLGVFYQSYVREAYGSDYEERLTQLAKNRGRGREYIEDIPAYLSREGRAYEELAEAKKKTTEVMAHNQDVADKLRTSTSFDLDAQKGLVGSVRRDEFETPELTDIVSLMYLPGEETWAEKWTEAAGFRLTHIFNPDKGVEYTKLRMSGAEPMKAGDATEEWYYELAGDVIADPLNVLPSGISRILFAPINVALTPVKFSANVVLSKSAKLSWLADASRRTQMQLAYNAPVDVFRYVRMKNPGASVDELVAILKNPAPGFVEEAGEYFGKEISLIQKYIDEAEHVAKYWKFGDDLFLKNLDDETVTLLKKLGADEDVIANLDSHSDFLVDVFADKVGRRMVDRANEEWVDVAKKVWGDKIGHVLDVGHVTEDAPKIVKVLSGTRRFLVESWLGLRPAWTLGNLWDNAWKSAIEGSNVFRSVADDWADYTRRIGPITREVTGAFAEYMTPGVRSTASEAKSGFLKEMWDAVSEKQRKTSVFRDLGAPPLGWFSEKNFAVSGAIEEGSRVRLYLSKFWGHVDTFQAGLRNLTSAKMAPEYAAMVRDMNPDVVRVVQTALNGAHRWTAGDVDNLIRRVDADEVILSRTDDIVAEADDTLRYFEQGHVFDSVKQKLDVMKERILKGEPVSTPEIFSALDDGYTEIEKARNAYFDKLVDTSRAKLIEVPSSADEMVKRVLPTGKQPLTPRGALQAWQDLESFQVSFERMRQVEQNKVWHKHWADGFSGDAFGEMFSDYSKRMNNSWRTFHKNYNDAQDLLLAEFKKIGISIPPQTVKSLREVSEEMDAMWRMTFAIEEKWMPQVRRAKSFKQRSKYMQQMQDELSANSSRRIQLDTLKGAARSDIIDRITDAGKVVGDNMSRLVGQAPWDLPTREMKKLGREADKFVAPVRKSMDDWVKASKQKTLASVRESVMQDATQRKSAVEFLKEIRNGVHKNINDAQIYATKETNRILFDYMRTSNLESLFAAGIMPFYKWQVRNVPYWLRTFVEKPTIVETVYDVKRLINEYNESQGLPTRSRNTLALPGGDRIIDFLEKRSIMGEYLADMKTQIRFDPFVFGPSFIQQTLAWSSFEERQLLETLESQDPELYKLYVAGQQAGLGLWPWHEWFLAQAFPEVFDDWYPDGILSDSYVIEWLADRYLDKPGLNPDRMYRAAIPAIINLVGDAKEFTPDKFLTYNTGREVRAMEMSGMPEDPNVARRGALWKIMASSLANKYTGASISFVSEYELMERELRAEKKAFINNQSDIYTDDEARELWYQWHPQWRAIDATWNQYPFSGDKEEVEQLQEQQRITNLRIEYFDKRKRIVATREADLNNWYKQHPMDKYGAGLIYDEYTETLDALSKEYEAQGVNFTWVPAGDTVDDIIQHYQSTIFRMVSNDSFPSREQYSDMQGVLDGEAYFAAQEEWRDNLVSHVMRLPALVEMEKALTEAGMARSDVVDIIEHLFEETGYDEWRRRNDTIMEALNETAYQYYYDPANEEWQLAKGEEGEDEALVKERRDMVLERWSGIPANELVDEVYAMYPNRWSKLELLQAYAGVNLPALQDSWWMNKTGRNRLIAMVQNKYYGLSALDKKNVREAFGAEFGEYFLNPDGDISMISNQRIGEWLNSLESMAGQPQSQFWNFKGVEGVKPPQKITDLKKFGVEMADPALSKEYDEAVALNDQYWLAIEADDQDAQDKIEDDVRWQKWFGSKPKSLFWQTYYNNVPPGVYGSEINNDPAIERILEKLSRGYMPDEVYTQGVEIIERWLETADIPGTPEEWKQAKAEYAEYREIPDDDDHKEDRRRFMATHPIMAFYYGGTKVRAAVAESQESLWAIVTSVAGEAIFDLTDELVGFWTGSTPLSDEAIRYLSFLHEQVAPKLEFKDFLDVLRDEYIQVYEESYGSLGWGDEDGKTTTKKTSSSGSYTRYAATPATKKTAFRRPTEPKIAMPWRSATNSRIEPRMRIRR